MLYDREKIEKEIKNKIRKNDLPPSLSDLPTKMAFLLFLYRWILMPGFIFICIYFFIGLVDMNIELRRCFNERCNYAEIPQITSMVIFLSAPYVIAYAWIYIMPFSHIFAYRYLFHIYIVGTPILISTSVLWSLYTYDVANRNGYVRCVSKWDSPHDIARPFARSPDLCEEALEKF